MKIINNCYFILIFLPVISTTDDYRHVNFNCKKGRKADFFVSGPNPSCTIHLYNLQRSKIIQILKEGHYSYEKTTNKTITNFNNELLKETDFESENALIKCTEKSVISNISSDCKWRVAQKQSKRTGGVPTCQLNQQKIFKVALYETALISCELKANPTDVQFIWKFNNSGSIVDIPQNQIHSEKMKSTVSYMPMMQQDYGTILCSGRNEVGMQKEPCIFHIHPPDVKFTHLFIFSIGLVVSLPIITILCYSTMKKKINRDEMEQITAIMMDDNAV